MEFFVFIPSLSHLQSSLKYSPNRHDKFSIEGLGIPRPIFGTNAARGRFAQSS